MKHSILAVKRMSGQDRWYLAGSSLLMVTIAAVLETFLLVCGRCFVRIIKDLIHYWQFLQDFRLTTLRWHNDDTVRLITTSFGLIACIFTAGLIAIVVCSLLRWNFVLKCRESHLSDAIEANHGKTLLAVLLGLRFAWFEYDVAFTSSGKKIDEGTLLSPVECNLRRFQEICDTGSCIGVHNHPLSENPFSHNDFAVAIARRESRSVVVAGSFVYTLELPEDTWELDEDKVKRHHKQLLHQAEMGGDSGEKLRRKYVEACRATAKRYGMRFREERYMTVLFRELRQAATQK